MWPCFQERPCGQHRAASASLTQDSEVLSHVRGGTAAMTTTELFCEPRAAELGSTRGRSAQRPIHGPSMQFPAKERTHVPETQPSTSNDQRPETPPLDTNLRSAAVCSGTKNSFAKWCQHQPASLRDSIFNKAIHSYDSHSEYVTKGTDPSARVQGLRPSRAGSSGLGLARPTLPLARRCRHLRTEVHRARQPGSSPSAEPPRGPGVRLALPGWRPCEPRACVGHSSGLQVLGTEGSTLPPARRKDVENMQHLTVQPLD